MIPIIKIRHVILIGDGKLTPAIHTHTHSHTHAEFVMLSVSLMSRIQLAFRG